MTTTTKKYGAVEFTPQARKKMAALGDKLSTDLGLTEIKMTPALSAALIKLRDAEKTLSMAPIGGTLGARIRKFRNIAVKRLCELLISEAA